MKKNCQRHLWLLTGTGEGPFFAESLLKKGWSVTVSVVSEKAADSYMELPLEDLLIGDLGGCLGIKSVLEKAYLKHSGFDCVIDATHPFATLITSSLEEVCREVSQPLLRYERPIEKNISDAVLIKGLSDLSQYDLTGESVLIALGSRQLKEAVRSVKNVGAKAYARILPSSESLMLALGSEIPESHLAPLIPFKGSVESNKIESALCSRWSIDNVLCRQSGGLVEKMWHRLCVEKRIKLWLITRPATSDSLEIVNSFDALIKRLER